MRNCGFQDSHSGKNEKQKSGRQKRVGETPWPETPSESGEFPLV